MKNIVKSYFGIALRGRFLSDWDKVKGESNLEQDFLKLKKKLLLMENMRVPYDEERPSVIKAYLNKEPLECKQVIWKAEEEVGDKRSMIHLKE